jgi:hypothetical protein
LASEQKGKLAGAGLRLDLGITHMPAPVGLEANNVEFRPEGSISKRPGLQRFSLVAMGAPVTCFLEAGGVYLTAAGNVDAR